MSFWRMAVVGHHTSVNCWVPKNCFWNTLKPKKQLAVNWSEVCCCFYKQLGKSQANFARRNTFLQTWCSVLWCIFPHKLLERSKCTFKTTLQTVKTNIVIWPTRRKHRCKQRKAGIEKRNLSDAFTYGN